MNFIRVLLLFFLLQVLRKCHAKAKNFDVTKYGAVGNGRMDNSKAFLDAWNDACQSGQYSRVLVPSGTFLVNTITFTGPCKTPIAFFLRGTMKAPSNPSSMHPQSWISFQYVDHLTVAGGGTVDGQGASSWSQHPQQVSMRFDFVNNSKIRHIKFINSKNVHLNIFGSTNVDVNKIRISAPGESPNTDGIKISESDRVTISQSTIGTGDDCIAILSGTTNLNVSDVVCGPGHGISVGSLGRSPGEKNVNGISVRNCTFKSTTNGVRIKSWAAEGAMVASGFTYEDILMNHVENPIIIDQMYCPSRTCGSQVASHVQIKDVTFKNIWGISKTKVAINLLCSKKFPCKNLVLNNINLVHKGPEGGATSSCANAHGLTYGRVQPTSCL